MIMISTSGVLGNAMPNHKATTTPGGDEGHFGSSDVEQIAF